MLLAEANQWPEDTKDYFGSGDECHMAFHFPLMPRMYMALAREDRFPITDIMRQTPQIPDSCQWAIFLRNHDELTLEMVTSKERDYMYSMYATDSRSRINVGIRRRLAPLLENDLDRIKPMNSLLLSMPGTPVLYYGDEIGMGDNIFLGDRDGVRTPMQWTSDRNGGFSRADPQRLYLPPIQDAVYGYEAVNVEAQSREPSSLLAWTRRLLAVRASSQAFGRGRFTMLHPGNRKVLAYVREQGDEAILCVANVSRRAQPVELDLASWKGRVPVEMMGATAFPPIGELPYLLTLPGHDFFWFRLATDAEPPRWHAETLAVEDLPVLVLFDGWNSFFRQRVVPWRIALAEKARAQLERQTLPRFVHRQRWYAGKAAPPGRVVLAEHAFVEAGSERWLMALADAQVEGEAPVRYCLPLAIAFEQDDERQRALAPVAASKVRQQADMGLLGDAMADEGFCRALVQFIGRGASLKTETGVLRGVPSQAWRAQGAQALREALPLRRLSLSSNSVSLLGDKLFLKLYRRVHPGVSVELEIGQHLTDVLHFDAAVPVLGSLAWTGNDGVTSTLAVLQACVTHQGDAWSHFVDQIALLLEAPDPAPGTEAVAPADPVAALAQRVQVLASRVAELHVALARRTGQAAFDPEPVTAADLRRWAEAVRAELEQTLARLARHGAAEALPLAQVVLNAGGRLAAAIDRAARCTPVGLKTRIHGDLHLQQVLLVRDDFLLIDFEGEPGRTLVERRERHSALRDLAGMLRSLDYARESALQAAQRAGARRESLPEQARQCERRLRQAFIDRYREVVLGGGLYGPEEFESALSLLELFEVEKALYELRYELDNRPDWLLVPLTGLAALARLEP
jgi:maltose alpha-D-glucosyltransferase/alpha-amylase